jgi:acetyltransferase-like isoleucine patch superfamily enzyme
MSPHQRRYAGGKHSLGAYKEYVLGESASWGTLAAYECYQTFLAGLGGAAGLFLRQKLAPHFFAAGGRKVVIGKQVTFYRPQHIVLGDRVILEDFATLDVKISEGRKDTPGISLGNHVLLGRHSMIVSRGPGTIRLDDAVNVSGFCRIGSEAPIHIGKSTLIAAFCYIGPGNHRFDRCDIPLIEQGMDPPKGIVIGDNAWIGTHSTILDGARIGHGAVIGAHSLVKGTIPDFAIAAGVPARVIKLRTELSVDGQSPVEATS